MEKLNDINLLPTGPDYNDLGTGKGIIAVPKGMNEALLNDGKTTNSVINKLHLIKLAGDYPSMEKDIPNKKEFFQARTFADLCKMETRAMQYDVDDFLYCKNLGFPINRLITLRRYPYPCTDNIWDQEAQGEPDIARMVTYFSQEVNKMDELLSFNYGLKWKELTAEMEQATMQGDQSGLSGWMKTALKAFDPNMSGDVLRGENSRMLDPKYDQNKVYGPVDSMTQTHIRDVGFDFSKEFEITFDYALRSINGRTPEYAMKDVIANILACTYNNGKFWPGSRYWIGERPSKFYERFQYMNTEDMDSILSHGVNDLKSAIKSFGNAQSAVKALESAMKGGMQIALGKILDKVGRPGILTMNSLLSGEPTGFWHLTIGNPHNPIMCIGNLICTNVDFSFPTDALSYGDFPTKLQVKVKLKPGQVKDRAGIEMMFNQGRKRIYYAPKHIVVNKNHSKHITRATRDFYKFTGGSGGMAPLGRKQYEQAYDPDTRDKKGQIIKGKPKYNKDGTPVMIEVKSKVGNEVDNMLTQAYDLIADGVKSVTETVVKAENWVEVKTKVPIAKNAETIAKNTWSGLSQISNFNQ